MTPSLLRAVSGDGDHGDVKGQHLVRAEEMLAAIKGMPVGRQIAATSQGSDQEPVDTEELGEFL